MMLESYFQYQAELVKTENGLKCPPDCNAPGCWRDDVIVEANLFDLLRLSLTLNIPVASLFFNHCYLGLQNSKINPRYQQLIIKLKKPCHFLENARCTVHGFKPLSCVLFPEYHQIIGEGSKLVENRIFAMFPCTNSKIRVSDERRNALKKLREMSSREEAISYHYIFGLPCFLVDSKPLTRQLKQTDPRNRSFFLKDYERLFFQHLKTTNLLDIVTDKIYQLKNRKNMEYLIKNVNDDLWMEPLMEKKTNPGIVHQIKRGAIKQLKRNLQRPDTIFI